MILDKNWRAKARRSVTVWVNAVSAAIFGWLWFDPTTLLYVWNMMPREVRPYLPETLLTAIGFALFILSTWARLRPKAEK